MRTLISPPELRARVGRLAGELSGAYADGVVLVAVLKGTTLFLADLIRAMSIQPVVDFLAVSSYAEGTGRVRIVKDLDLDVTDTDVVLVEDIIDTGLSVSYLLGELGRRGPRTLEVCALLDRPARRVVPVPLRFVGFEIPDEFVIGYGLDHAERYRNLDLVATADIGVLRRDPDALVRGLYGEG
ncbi:MAG: hypoxanthine phosphoribosyltransferase [Acidimicrobiales bacterium]